jgi:hypothetical protein
VPGLVYSYVADLDSTGHAVGPGTMAWRIQLGQVDRLVEALAERLPAGTVLLVTGDHGMVEPDPDERVDLEVPQLSAGVRAIGGEPRARHVYACPGAEQDVLAAWREQLHDRAWVVSRDEAVSAGWFGPVVPDRVRPHIGDVVAAASGRATLVRPAGEPSESKLLGHHGSFTSAEQLVPLVEIAAG